MAIYYVATNGSDSGNGSPSNPWRTINYAVQSNLQPGDQVVVRPGTYNETVNITRDGSAAGDITLRSEIPGAAKIDASGGFTGIMLDRANYITIDGFEITGGRGSGIGSANAHHITVKNNHVHDNDESGVQLNYGEFFTIENNLIHGNASGGWFSGISIYQARNITGDTTTPGPRVVIRNNVSADNVTGPQGPHTDGNGIILDDFNNGQNGSTAGNYAFPSLVENNLLHGNGGKGIAVHWSDHVMVRNNTAYHNNMSPYLDGTWQGELSNQDSDNNVWANNIAVTDPTFNNRNNTAIGFYGDNSNVVWKNNLTYNGIAGNASMRLDGGNPALTASDGNLLGVNPGFSGALASLPRYIDVGTKVELGSTSPAVNAGTSAYGLASSDLDGGPRVVDTVDLGAYKSGEADPNNGAPAFTSGNFTVNENTSVAGTLTAVDPEGDTLIFAKIGGDDATRFSVNASTGVVSFNSTPDYEVPLDANGDNVYQLAVSVSDGHNARVSKTIAITVQNVNDPLPPPQTGSSFFSPSATPAATETGDTADYELGMQFRPLTGGEITALRYYRGAPDANDTDIRTLHLWSSTGTELAEVTIGSAPGVTGWQTVALPTPVKLTANSTYVVSYGTTQNYADTQNFFGTTKTNADGTLSTPTGAGVFSGAPGIFPTQTWNASNYWADVIFKPASQPPMTITGTSGTDTLFGDAGNDTLSGWDGNDRIQGNGGADFIRGGVGSDTFVYVAVSDSTPTAQDTIADLARGIDKIDLKAIDAVPGGGDNAFIWIGTSAFSGAAGQLRTQSTSSGLILQGDVNGDGTAEISIALSASFYSLTASDILL